MNGPEAGDAMSMAESQQWWTDRLRRVSEAEEVMSAEHFADPDAKIPDLDFAPPDCPICLRGTTYDDGTFTCDVCCVTWQSNGYGSDATREVDA